MSIFGLEPDPEAGFDTRLEPLSVVRPADDAGSFVPSPHKIDLIPGELPDSLRKAIRAFILACAARAQRGAAKEHNSMLVHVTRFIPVQRLVHEKIAQELKDVVNRLRYGDGTSARQVMDEFRELWNEDFVPTTRAVQRRVEDPMITEARWEDIQPLLSAAAQKIVVKRISGSSEDVPRLPERSGRGERHRRRRRQAVAGPDPGGSVSQLFPQAVPDVRHPDADGPLVRISARISGPLSPLHPGQSR